MKAHAHSTTTSSTEQKVPAFTYLKGPPSSARSSSIPLHFRSTAQVVFALHAVVLRWEASFWKLREALADHGHYCFCLKSVLFSQTSWGCDCYFYFVWGDKQERAAVSPSHLRPRLATSPLLFCCETPQISPKFVFTCCRWSFWRPGLGWTNRRTTSCFISSLEGFLELFCVLSSSSLLRRRTGNTKPPEFAPSPPPVRFPTSLEAEFLAHPLPAPQAPRIAWFLYPPWFIYSIFFSSDSCLPPTPIQLAAFARSLGSGSWWKLVICLL